MKKTMLCATVVALLAGTTSTFAAVTADEAAKLKTTLTPLGGEKAGNKDGSIPAWDASAKLAAGAKAGDIPTQVFPGEK